MTKKLGQSFWRYSITVLLALIWATTGMAQTEPTVQNNSRSESAQTHYQVLYTFRGGVDGGSFPSSLILDSAGNLYGTTASGGASNNGTVFKVATSGKESVLHSFNGADGDSPYSGVIRDAAGNFYGTTSNGLAYAQGVVFKLDSKGVETVLYRFTDGADGGLPLAGVVRDDAGNLYGTTNIGGTLGDGTAFKIDRARKETVLHSFDGGPADGVGPVAPLIRDTPGNLYGTTYGGGDTNFCAPYGCGTVFRLDTAGKETVLHNFKGGSDGAQPNAGLLRDNAGNLYGTTFAGGGTGCTGIGCGTVFKLDALGRETVLHRFTGGADGASPYGGLIRDAAGNLYGTTSEGGEGGGVVFRLDKSGTETVLHNFTGSAGGSFPQATLVRDGKGNLYGTTAFGGDFNCICGVVFKLSQ